jgi:hypothetical protein
LSCFSLLLLRDPPPQNRNRFPPLNGPQYPYKTPRFTIPKIAGKTQRNPKKTLQKPENAPQNPRKPKVDSFQSLRGVSKVRKSVVRSTHVTKK